MPPVPAPARAYLLLSLVMLFWAGNSIVGRAIRDDIGPLTLAFLRWTGALAIVLPFAWRRLSGDLAILRRHWTIVLALGLLGIAAFNALLYSGLRFTTASNGLLLQAGIPALVLLFDRLCFGIRPRARDVAGVTLATSGVALIVFRADWHALIAFRLGLGDALILIAVAVWGLYTSLLRLRPPVAPSSLLAATFAIGVAAMLPFAAWEWSRGMRITSDWPTIGGIAYVVLFPSTLAYAFYNRAVATVGPASAGRTIALLPLFGAFLAALLLGERLHGYHAVGMMLILGGIAVPLIRSSRAAPRG